VTSRRLIAITLLPVLNVLPIGLVVGERYPFAERRHARSPRPPARGLATNVRIATAGVRVVVTIGVLRP
jgi:hypothetical protein